MGSIAHNLLGDSDRFLIQDLTNGTLKFESGDAYNGPVSGLDWQYVTLTNDTLLISAEVPNVFIHGSSGDDAIAAKSGRNVLDGSTGSNWLAGGSGQDTFFIDDRQPTKDVWSTVVDASRGDDVTVFGITPTNATVTWTDNQGAANGLGLTMHATMLGKPTASFTLAGYSVADLRNGTLDVSFGANGGDPYMHIQIT